MSRWYASFVLSLAVLSSACQTGAVAVVYDDKGRMIRCVMLEVGDSSELPEGERRIVSVKLGDWDEAFARLGITREECAALSRSPLPTEKQPVEEP